MNTKRQAAGQVSHQFILIRESCLGRPRLPSTSPLVTWSWNQSPIPLCPHARKIKTSEDTKVNRAEGTRQSDKARQADEWLTLISVLVSTAGGAQRHPGGAASVSHLHPPWVQGGRTTRPAFSVEALSLSPRGKKN